MNLELLEQTCLKYLSESQQPIVPVEVLLEFCRRTPALAQAGREILVQFLRDHEEVEFLPAPAAADDDPAGAGLLAAAGMAVGDRAVLKRRVPTQRELYAHMALQLEDMRATLQETLRQAEGTPREASLRAAIERVDLLTERLGALLR